MLFLAVPLVAVIGIAAVFFVLRRKSVEKRSMYSARRSQIEHKVRAARQRTLTPHGHAEKAAEQPEGAPGASPFDQTRIQPTIAYQTPAYEAPPVAPPAPPPARPQQAPSPPPWETPSSPAPAPSSFDYPAATPEPYTPAPVAPPEPFRPPPEPTPMPPSERSWTPAPKPARTLAPAQTVAPAASATAAGSWGIVSTPKDSNAPQAPAKGKGKGGPKAGPPARQLAPGETPGTCGGDRAGSQNPPA